MTAGEMALAHHPFVTAMPFVVPAVLVVALVAAIIWRDRREERDERAAQGRTDAR